MDIKDVTGWLGIEATDLDSFKKNFDEKYKTKDQFLKDPEVQKEFMGKSIGKIQNEVVRLARAHGVEFSKDEIEGKPIEEISHYFLKKQADSYLSQIEELKKTAGAGSDEKVKEWESKYEKLQSKYKDTENLLKNTTQEYEGFKQTAAQQVKGVKLDYVKSNMWSGIKFDPSVDNLKKKGFEAVISEKYMIDLDENDSPFIATKDGKRIPNPQRHDQFLSVAEVLQKEADEAGLTAKNQQAGKPAFFSPAAPPAPGTPQVPQAPQPRTGRKLAARATQGLQ